MARSTCAKQIAHAVPKPDSNGRSYPGQGCPANDTVDRLGASGK